MTPGPNDGVTTLNGSCAAVCEVTSLTTAGRGKHLSGPSLAGIAYIDDPSSDDHSVVPSPPSCATTAVACS